MTLPQPPDDLDRAERKAFRKTAQTLAGQGVDVIARADLLADFIRSGTRLAELRRQEKLAGPDQKMAAARAVNVAGMERRRLRDQLWRGVKMQRRVPTVSERAAEIATDEGREAWRRFHHGDRSLSRTELEARYGKGDIATVLYETAEEEAADLAYLERCAGRLNPPGRFEDFDDDDDDGPAYD